MTDSSLLSALAPVEVSERQRTDAVGVMRVSAGRLDLAYLSELAGELGVRDLLQRALMEAEG